MAHPLRTPVKDVFPFATWLGSISAFRVHVGSFNYRCTRASARCKAGGWQSMINRTDCRSPVRLARRGRRNPTELTRLRPQIVFPANVSVFLLAIITVIPQWPRNRRRLTLNLATCNRQRVFPVCFWSDTRKNESTKYDNAKIYLEVSTKLNPLWHILANRV